MKGTEKITAHIIGEAEAKAADVISEAKKKAEGISAEYAVKAKAEYTERIRAGVRECEGRVDRMERMAQMESRKSVLALKQELMSEAFARAEKLVQEMPEKDYTAFLAKLAADASVDGDEEIILSSADSALAPAVLSGANALLNASGKNGKLRLSAESGSFDGGLILRKGGIDINCTVKALIDSVRNEVSPAVADVLFG